MRRSVIIIIAVVFILAGFYFFQSHETSDNQQGVLAKLTQLLPQTSAVSATANAQVSSAGTPPTNTLPPMEINNPPDFQTMNDLQIKDWIRQESRTMNSTSLNADEIQIRLRAQSQTLAPEQLTTLVKFVQDTAMPANERILAAYMLNLNSTTAGIDAMYELSAQPVVSHGVSVPHSEAELRNAQEMALRYMQVDELFARARTDSNARDKLSLLSQQAQSEQVRSYAQRKLQELQ